MLIPVVSMACKGFVFVIFRVSLVIIGLIATLYYAAIVPAACKEVCPQMHERIVANDYTSPWVYRVLTPFTVELIRQSGLGENVYTAYVALHVFLLPATLLALFEWLRLSMSSERAFGACMMFSFLLPLIFITSYGIGAWSLAEVLFLCLSFLLIQLHINRNLRFALLMIITILSALNRSTAIFIPFAYFIVNLDFKNIFDRRLWLESGILAGACFLILATVRAIRGDAPPMIIFPENIYSSIQTLGAASLINNALLMPLWLLAAYKWRDVNSFLRRLIWIVPFFVLAGLLFGKWNEIRIWMPLFPIALAMIFAETTSETSSNRLNP